MLFRILRLLLFDLATTFFVLLCKYTRRLDLGTIYCFYDRVDFCSLDIIGTTWILCWKVDRFVNFQKNFWWQSNSQLLSSEIVFVFSLEIHSHNQRSQKIKSSEPSIQPLQVDIHFPSEKEDAVFFELQEYKF